MAKSAFLTDKELIELTSPFLADELSLERALELATAGCLSMITEPGDRMGGALARCLGRENLVSLLIGGLETKAVIDELSAKTAVDELRAQFGKLEETISDSRQRWLPRFSKSRLRHLFNQSASLGLSLVTPEDKNWPQGVNDLEDARPSILFVEGNANLLSGLQTSVSIVGSRTATAYGIQVTDRLVRKLAIKQRATVSGGALGIDSVVHRTSLEVGLPTVAVMAGGLDRKYPRHNSGLFEAIKTQGVLISELPPGVAPTRWRFLQRNRIIAALSPTTVIVEAGLRSGSIRTANNALDLERDLYAVPGSVLSGTSLGTNELIATNKASILNDVTAFATGTTSYPIEEFESSLAKRAKDAVREIGFPSALEIAKAAGLTRSEVEVAVTELTRANQLIQQRTSGGELHYALNHG